MPQFHTRSTYRLARVVVGVLPAILLSLGALRPTPLAVSLSQAAARVLPAPSGSRVLPAGEMVWQRSLNDCGPASLANYLRANGAGGSHLPPVPDLDSLDRLAILTPTGTRLGDLADAATKAGWPSWVARVDPTEGAASLRGDRLPAIAWIEQSHFVTLTRLVAGDSVEMIDPMRGRLLVSWNGLLAVWRGEFLNRERPPAAASARFLFPSSPLPRSHS